MGKQIKRLLSASLVLALVALAFGYFTPVRAAANDVVINELMYNPQSGVNGDEYLELYNRTASPIDLNGWCLADGITLCFTAGMTIAAHGYVVVSSDITRTNTTYGVTAIAAYAGNLSNGGELVTLKDASNNTVNAVTYDDVAPWPTAPDGGGHSLELKDPDLDNSQGVNWGANINAPTPGAQNSLTTVTLPTITDVNDPNDIPASQAVTITANVQDADTVELKYKVNYDSEQTVTMLDDGNSGDGPASDGVYGAEIPGQAARDLVRFKIEATNNDGTSKSPSTDDSMNYRGYVITDPSLTSAAPIINLYMSDADFDDMHTNHVNDDVYVPAVIAYGNDVYDNAQIRIKGEYSRTFPKKPYKVKLPSGYTINMAGGSNRSIKEFHLNNDYGSETLARVPTAWWVAEQAGMPIPDITPVRLQHNGQFEGMYIYAEKYENEWRTEKGYNNGPMYEDFVEPQSNTNGDTDAALEAWRDNMLLDRKDPTKRDYVLDNNNIPALISYMSIEAIVDSHDHSAYGNTFVYRDNSTMRWRPLIWDLDLIFQEGARFNISPYEAAGYTYLPYDRFMSTSIYDQSDMRQMFFRRLRTLADQFYGNNALIDKYQEVKDTYADEMQLDLAKWPDQGGFMRTSGLNDLRRMNFLKDSLYALYTNNRAMPAAQTDQEKQSVYFDQVISTPVNSNEYIKISNSSNAYVDISNWQITGINYTIPAGTVVPANGSIYLVKEDKNYRDSHPSVFIAGQYDTDLSAVSGTNLVLKTDANQEIDSYDY